MMVLVRSTRSELMPRSSVRRNISPPRIFDRLSRPCISIWLWDICNSRSKCSLPSVLGSVPVRKLFCSFNERSAVKEPIASGTDPRRDRPGRTTSVTRALAHACVASAQH